MQRDSGDDDDGGDNDLEIMEEAEEDEEAVMEDDDHGGIGSGNRDASRVIRMHDFEDDEVHNGRIEGEENKEDHEEDAADAAAFDSLLHPSSWMEKMYYDRDCSNNISKSLRVVPMEDVQARKLFLAVHPKIFCVNRFHGDV
jgi:hypothetical protein